MNKTEKMIEFIRKSPSMYHVISNMEEVLQKSGYERLDEKESWALQKNRKYYVTRNGSSLIAFHIPKGEARGFQMVASHSDSPTFKVKENPEIVVDEKYIRLNVEKYGGMILSTWFDRLLSVAGRVIVRKNGVLVEQLVNIDKDLMVIPSVAIHMNYEMNKGIAYNPQTDLSPLFMMGKEKQGFRELLAQELQVDTGDILGSDLYLYVREQGRLFGGNDDFVISPKLDDLQSVYASMTAMSESTPTIYMNVCAVFDNEEVGSGTKQGADSTFLQDTLERIRDGMGYTREQYLRMIADSFLISADNAHAVHPNHPEYADPTNRPYLNGGIVLKYQGSQKYTTDAVSAARMKDICDRAEVPYQTYFNRSDIAGGSTLGNISTAHVSVSSVDIGFPQLAMHSAVETAGAKDTAYGIRAFEEFYKE
ncbi:MAG: M18 family aminopeptidase [Lachnospiraceae bacterium]|nr:M18 family aminopeptidase [Lachnospiraceae bacterium]